MQGLPFTKQPHPIIFKWRVGGFVCVYVNLRMHKKYFLTVSKSAYIGTYSSRATDLPWSIRDRSAMSDGWGDGELSGVSSSISMTIGSVGWSSKLKFMNWINKIVDFSNLINSHLDNLILKRINLLLYAEYALFWVKLEEHFMTSWIILRRNSTHLKTIYLHWKRFQTLTHRH